MSSKCQKLIALAFLTSPVSCNELLHPLPDESKHYERYKAKVDFVVTNASANGGIPEGLSALKLRLYTIGLRATASGYWYVLFMNPACGDPGDTTNPCHPRVEPTDAVQSQGFLEFAAPDEEIRAAFANKSQVTLGEFETSPNDKTPPADTKFEFPALIIDTRLPPGSTTISFDNAEWDLAAPSATFASKVEPIRVPFLDPLKLANGETVTVTLKYSLDEVISRGPEATGLECRGEGNEKVCVALPKFSAEWAPTPNN